MGTSVPAASGVAKRPVRKATCRGQEDQSSSGSSLPADQDCAAENFAICDDRLSSGGKANPGAQRIPLGRTRDPRRDRRSLKPFGVGSDRHGHARGRRGRRAIGLRRGRPCAVLGRMPGRDEKNGRQPKRSVVTWPSLAVNQHARGTPDAPAPIGQRLRVIKGGKA